MRRISYEENCECDISSLITDSWIQVAAMNISNFLSALLHELQRLYNQVVLTRLHKLMDGYHKHTNHSKKPHAKDIKASLLEYVDNVVVLEKEKAKTPHDVEHPVGESGVIGKHVTQSHHTLFPFNVDKKHVGPNPYKLNKKQVEVLSKYFKARTKGSELHPGIEEKLKDSIWDHINASVQCALKGDNRNAKMHVDIANYAFNEIAHYMPEEQYLELTRKINKRLDALKVDQ